MKLAETYMAYQLVKRLATPFSRWPAHAAGIIDKDGKVLKKYSELTDAQKNTYSPFDAAVLKIKKAISLVPGGGSTIGSIAAGIMLLKRESDEMTDWETEHLFYEDAPTNSAGSGQVAGMGQGPQGEPASPGGLFKKYKNLKKRKTKP